MRSTREYATCYGHIIKEKFQKGMPIFHKNSGKGYNIWKKFRIRVSFFDGTNTNQKTTELIDYFDLVWTKHPQF